MLEVTTRLRGPRLLVLLGISPAPAIAASATTRPLAAVAAIIAVTAIGSCVVAIAPGVGVPRPIAAGPAPPIEAFVPGAPLVAALVAGRRRARSAGFAGVVRRLDLGWHRRG